MDFEALERDLLNTSVFDGGMEVYGDTEGELSFRIDLTAEEEDPPLVKAQKLLEQEMQMTAQLRYKESNEKLARLGQRDKVRSFSRLMNEDLTAAADELQELYVRIQQSKEQPEYATDGRLLRLIERFMRLLSWDQMAYIGLQYIMQALDREEEEAYEDAVVRRISEGVDFEAFATYLNEKDERLLGIIGRRYLESPTTGKGKKIRGTIDFLEGSGADRDIEWDFLNDHDKVALGNFIKDAVFRTGLFESKRIHIPDSVKTPYKITLTDYGRERHKGIEGILENKVNMAAPMLIPPLPWGGLDEHGTLRPGGYYLPAPGDRSRMIHNFKGTHVAPEALQALNNVQSVAWKMNQFILDIQDYYIKNQISVTIGKFSVSFDKTYVHDKSPEQLAILDAVDYENPEEWEKGAEDPELLAKLKAAWKVKRSLDEKRKLNKQRTVHPVRVLRMAKKFRNHPEIFMPWFFDNRLRMYCLVETLNPQSSDCVKALLQFAKGSPVSDHSKWELLVSIATTYGNGYDKKSYAERVKKATELVEPALLEIFASSVSAAVSDEGVLIWEKADEPWTFLALCHEYYRLFVLNDQEDRNHYVSSGRDATCSGIQITGALLRDYQTCKFVNVLKSDTVQDAYGEVAAKARILLQDAEWVTKRVEHREARRQKQIEKRQKEERQRREEGGIALPMPAYEPRYTCDIPLQYVDRSVAKMVVMLTPYGGQYITMLKHVMSKLDDKGVELHPLDYEILTHALIDGMAIALPAFAGLNQWFKDLAKLTLELYEDKNQIVWVPPVHDPSDPAQQSRISQEYRKDHMQTVKTYIHNETQVNPRYFKKKNPDEFASELQTSKMQTALAANVVHSLDAAIIQLAVANYSNSAFTCVHDCVYAPSGNLRLLTDRIKKAFYDVCSSNFLLDIVKENELERTDLADRIKEMTGDANIEEVRDSDYLFC